MADVNTGTKNTNLYEVAVLYHPDLEIDLEKATSRVEKIFTDNGGEVTNTDNWGKRKLAYPIKKLEHAVYIFYTVEFPAESVRKVEALLNITDEVIRFLIVRPDLKKIAKAEALRAEKLKKAEARKAAGNDDDKDDKNED
jgi:small subunit ribosomal protein S6